MARGWRGFIYDTEVEPFRRFHNEDYQRSRWGELTVWDMHEQTVPMNIRGSSSVPNAINGGWGADTILGGNLDDVLRGGPGKDRLTGLEGGDRFQIFRISGNDTITDFAPEDGDSIDLTGIFGHLSGSPSDFVRIRQVIVRMEDQLPRVDSVLELDHDGAENGWTVDQTITLENRSFGNSHLPRLTGEGSLQLGLSYFSTGVEIVSSNDVLYENGLPQEIILKRTGNLDAALDVSVVFTGSAEINADYSLSVDEDSKAVRTLHFERDQEEVSFEIVPLIDNEDDNGSVIISLLSDPRITATADFPLELPLIDVARFAVHTRRHVDLTSGGETGLAMVTRQGPGLENAAQIRMIVSGTLESGRDFQEIPATVSFAPGQSEVLVEILPQDEVSEITELNYIILELLPEPSQAVESGNALVLFLPSGSMSTPSFTSWSKAYFPGIPPEEAATGDLNLNSISNLFEYIFGNSPDSDSESDGEIEIHITGGSLELCLETTFGWTDIELRIHYSEDFTRWEDVTSGFTVSLEPLSDDRVLRSYRRKPGLQLSTNGFYRLSAVLIGNSD